MEPLKFDRARCRYQRGGKPRLPGGKGDQIMHRIVTTPNVRVGDRVEVKTRFSGDWAAGFEVDAVTDAGCRVRRVSDGAVLPALFDFDDIRIIDDNVDTDGWCRGCEVSFERPDLARLWVRLPPTLDIAAVEAVRAPLLKAIDAARE